ncbi:hypothetical protein BW898_16255 [Bacillus cereus]|nr:hypothetical protein BW898_16255 [Bacillus cereus]
MNKRKKNKKSLRYITKALFVFMTVKWTQCNEVLTIDFKGIIYNKRIIFLINLTQNTYKYKKIIKNQLQFKFQKHTKRRRYDD